MKPNHIYHLLDGLVLKIAVSLEMMAGPNEVNLTTPLDISPFPMSSIFLFMIQIHLYITRRNSQNFQVQVLLEIHFGGVPFQFTCKRPIHDGSNFNKTDVMENSQIWPQLCTFIFFITINLHDSFIVESDSSVRFLRYLSQR